MSKNIKGVFRALFIIIMLVILVGCNQGHKDGPLWAIENQGDPSPPIWLAISAEKSRIESGEDLQLNLYYRPIGEYYDTRYSHRLTQVNCKITMSRHNDDQIVEDDIVVREIDNFSDELYVEHSHNDILYRTAVENIVCPADWFQYEKGAISWFVTMELIFSDNTSPRYEGSGISLYYIKEKNSILLFGSYYNFHNYQR